MDPSATTVPSATDAPLPTSSASASANFLAGLRYTCGGADFPIELLDTPQHAELSDDPPAAVLRGNLWLGEVDSWWLIERAESSAEYVGLGGDFGIVYVLADIHEGAWRARGYGDCQMRAVVPGATVVTWWIRERSWPSADDRTLDLTVRDGCPKTVGERLLEPIIRWDSESIVIVLPTKTVDQKSCGLPEPSEQLTQVRISLEEPVGDRELFDGASWPLRNAHTRSDEILWCCG